jgi:multimeric flavodoxin WrbA
MHTGLNLRAESLSADRFGQIFVFPQFVNKTINALFLNCTLKSSPIKSNTEGLMKEAIEIMQREGIQTEMTRPIDLDLHHSVDPVLDQDDWPGLFNKIRHSNILVIGSPVWLGEKSSVAAKLFEAGLKFCSGNTDSDV